MRQELFFPIFIGLYSTMSLAATAPANAPIPLTATKTTAPAATVAPAASVPPINAGTLATARDKVSYAIGIDMGTNLKNQNIDVNADVLARGIKDATSNGQLLLSQQEIGETLANLQKQIMAKREADMKGQADRNKRAGDAFLQANKTKPGVVTLPSGLQYKVITPGNGRQPTDKDNVTVNYSGTLINGQEFDSSYRRGKPVSFPVGEVIPGWSEALRLMKTGSTWEIYVPPNLGYGERGLTGGPIGPNQTLVFKINLVSVNKK